MNGISLMIRQTGLGKNEQTDMHTLTWQHFVLNLPQGAARPLLPNSCTAPHQPQLRIPRSSARTPCSPWHPTENPACKRSALCWGSTRGVTWQSPDGAHHQYTQPNQEIPSHHQPPGRETDQCGCTCKLSLTSYSKKQMQSFSNQ